MPADSIPTWIPSAFKDTDASVGSCDIHGSVCQFMSVTLPLVTTARSQVWPLFFQDPSKASARCLFLSLFSGATNKMQRYTIYLFLWNALHVSGGSSAHHQELKLYIQHLVLCQTFTATCQCCGRDGTQEFHLFQVAVKVWQSTWCYIYSLSSWWWAEEPPETCRAFHKNK